MSETNYKWLIEALSDEQLKPLNRNKRNASILASAGSGKTRTLTHSLCYELAKGTSPGDIIAYTFTEKAADELLAKINSIAKLHLSEVDLSKLHISTIHAWCHKYLINKSDFYNFSVVDELHLYSLVARLYDFLNLKEIYKSSFPHGINKFITDFEIYYNEHLAVEDLPTHIRGVILQFEELLFQNRLLTYGGMIRNTINYLEKNGPLESLRYLFVDEYQDVNPAQVQLINNMLPRSGSLIVVGDDLQSIYNWRGSDVKRIIKFPEEFNDSQVFRLSNNYRSKSCITTVANNFANKIEIKDEEKSMVSKRKEDGTCTVCGISVTTEEKQAESVTEIVKNLVSNGYKYNQIAILLRSVKNHGQIFADNFSSHNIPFNCPVLNRGNDFIDTLILPVFNWLKHDHREPTSEYELLQLQEFANQIWESTKKWIPAGKNEEDFWIALSKWLYEIEGQNNDSYNIRLNLYNFFDELGIKISSTDNDLLLGIGIATQIIRSVEEMHRRRIKDHSRVSAKKLYSEAYYSLLNNKDNFGESIPIDQQKDGVIISTVHQAKGLEWPVVIIPMLKNGIFPVRSRSHRTSFSDDIAGRYGTKIDDERRLFYVAITRAMDKLFLLDYQDYSERSKFSQEIDSKQMPWFNSIGEVPTENYKFSPVEIDYEQKPLRIGLSDLIIFTECPYQYGLRKSVQIQPSVGDELGFGKSMHEIIQRRHEADGSWSEEEMYNQIEKNVFLPLMSAEGEDKAKHSIRKRLNTLEELNIFESKTKSEIDVEITLNGNLVFGTADGLIKLNNDKWLLRDWKSSIHDKFLSRYITQMHFYTYALRKRGYNITRAELVDIKKTHTEKKIEKREIDISDSAIKDTIENLSEAIDHIKSNKFKPTPSELTCSSCDVNKICNYSQAKDEDT